ncbi:hypothetical protein BC829DRAFT_368335 [Chytridium lagenaria]|nr:hypothetical protein BC829DRAFT_368335 [Chytridium lagenaria]
MPHPNCHRTFPTASQLKNHRKSHTRRPRFSCPIPGCDTSRLFCTNQELQRHVNSHTKKKEHRCPGCGSMFSRQDAMMRHWRGGGVEVRRWCECCGGG